MPYQENPFYYKVICNCGWTDVNNPSDLGHAKETAKRHLKSCFLSNPTILINKTHDGAVLENNQEGTITITR